MTKQWTDKDVERLVEIAVNLEKTIKNEQKVWNKSAYHQDLLDALKPFLPDPEDELVEAMAREEWRVWNNGLGWDNGRQADKNMYLQSCRASLTLLKERGLLKELS